MPVRLKEVTPRRDAGFSRVRSADEVRFQDAEGRPLPPAALARARALMVPPAWTDVWISADPNGHIQAVGIDDAGRAQYIYHPAWVAAREVDKFDRMLVLAAALPTARARVTRAIRQEGLGAGRVLAAAFRLLDDVGLRVGSDEYLARYGTRGLTTLRCQDAACEGSVVTLEFVGKGGLRIRRQLEDADVAAVVGELARSSGRARLLAYRSGRRRVPIRAADVNEYVQSLTAAEITAKDFRTLHGGILAAQALARIGPRDTTALRRRAQQSAVAEVARFLGNTPAVARRSYIDPRIFRRYEQGAVLDVRRSPESALRRLLEA